MSDGAPWELAVVGAGVVGVSAAYLAARSGARVLLLDQAAVGAGATRWSAALDVPWAPEPAKRALADESAALWKAFSREAGVRLRRLPCFAVVEDGDRERVIAGFGGAAREASQAALVYVTGYVEPGASACVLALDRALRPPPVETTRRLARAARRGGAEVWEGARVDALEADGEGQALHLGDGRRVRARRVLVATGPWIGRGPGAEAARRHGVRVKTVAALHVDARPRPGAPAVLFPDDDAFLLPMPERGQWLFSFASQAWDPAPEGPHVIGPSDWGRALEILSRRAPSLTGRVRGGRVFCDAFAPD
ncbi:MAG TPA: FAD-dependent oxidoreductase, partial [Longimicrobium sp.]|nr:FAD-dependent oxidoreductase [Longimicrobium sp.]